VIRYGKAASGKQRYRCHGCHSTFCENPQPPGYTEVQKQQILRAYRERSS
jgi:transposase-like protein